MGFSTQLEEWTLRLTESGALANVSWEKE
jgi:hypothetical protein